VRLLLPILLAGCCLGQYSPTAPLASETLRLARLRLAAATIFEKLPNFTCTLTIERSSRPAANRRFDLIDNVRLEVALIEGKELFAWPGAKGFEDSDLADMVGDEGTIGTGDFAGHAKSILLSQHTKLKFEAEETAGGRRFTRWSFHHPIEASQYVMRMRPLEGAIGYSGTVWADAANHDPVRIEMDLNEIPAHLPLQGGRKTITYQRVPIGASTFLLPASADLVLIMANGFQSRNVTTFSNCRQFTGASTIRFDDPPPEAPAAAAKVSWTLPGNLPIVLKTMASLDFSKAAVGDLIPLTVAKNAVSAKLVWLPAGASVSARLVSVHCGESPMQHCFAYLRLESFSFENKEGVIRAAMEMPTLDHQLSAAPPIRRWLIPRPPGDPANPPAVHGAIFVRGTKWSRSSTMLWRTLKEPGGARP